MSDPHECINKIIKSSRGKVSKDEAIKILDELQTNKEKFLESTEGSLKDFIAREKKADAAQKQAKFLESRNRLLDAEKKIGNLKRLEEVTKDPALLKDVGEKIVTKAEVDAKGILSNSLINVKRKLRAGDLLDDYENFTHSKEISLELANIGNHEISGKPGDATPVTRNPKAFEMAKILAEEEAIMRSSLNDEGANIGQTENFIGTQSHSGEELSLAGYDVWKPLFLDALDFERSFDGDWKKLSADELEDALGDLFRTLASGIHDLNMTSTELRGLDPLSGLKGNQNLAKKVSAHRKIHFKPEKWNDYSKRFGGGGIENVFNKMMSSHARTLSLMRNFGTNPEAHLFGPTGIFEQVKRKSKGLAIESGGIHPLDTDDLQVLYGFVTGAAKRPIHSATNGLGIPGSQLAKYSNRVAQANVMSKLGSVVISSLNDSPIKSMVLMNRGVNSGEAISTAFNDFYGNFGSETRKEIADSLALGLEDMIGGMFDTYRTSADLGSNTVLGKKGDVKNIFKALEAGNAEGKPLKGAGKAWDAASETFMNMTLLNQYNKNAKAGVSVTIANLLGKNSKKAFGSLDNRIQQFLVQYDLHKNWDALRAHVETMPDGTQYITPDAIAKITDADLQSFDPSLKTERELRKARRELGDKVSAMLVDIRDTAILTPDAKTDKLVSFGSKRGTLWGEGLFHFMQFKKFPVMMMTRIFGDEIMNNPTSHKLGSLIALSTSLTAMGYGVMSLKAIARGETPPDMRKGTTILAAMSQGGALAILGDIVLRERGLNLDIISELAGPTFKTADDLIRLGLSPIYGEADKMPKQAAKLFKKNLPFVNLFYTRWAFEFLFLNDIMKEVDPDFERNKARSLETRNRGPLLEALGIDAPDSLGEAISQ